MTLWSNCVESISENSDASVHWFPGLPHLPPVTRRNPRIALTRIFHQPRLLGVAATAGMGILPGVLGSSFDGTCRRAQVETLRTSSPCDVLFRYASDAKPCACPVACPSSSRSLRFRLRQPPPPRLWRARGFGETSRSVPQAGSQFLRGRCASAQSRKRVPSFFAVAALPLSPRPCGARPRFHGLVTSIHEISGLKKWQNSRVKTWWVLPEKCGMVPACQNGLSSLFMGY
jgi:hypothetical protein